MAAQIYMIRHGKTSANIDNKFAGRTDEPLSDIGSEQIMSLKPEIDALGVQAIYTGALPRTVETAEILSGGNTPIIKTQSLIDIDLPHWDGLTKDEIRSNFGDEYPTWLSSPEKFNVKGCENLQQVQGRAVSFLAEVVKNNPSGNILLVTHLIVARCLLLAKDGLPIAKFREIKVDNGEIVKL